MCITFKTAKLWLENLFLLQAWDNLFESKAQLIRGSARIAYQTCFQDVKIKDVSDDECDLPPYDDSSKNHDFTFSNPLFDIDEDFTLSDESFSEEDIPKENFIIFSNPLFDLDEEIASTKNRFPFRSFAGELILPKSIPPEIEEVEFDTEGDILFLESLLYDNSSPRPPEALKPF
ncbi:hypothetical protein Tco_0256895 [Tanacetum coccineum]